jgi:hypothetical protein
MREGRGEERTKHNKHRGYREEEQKKIGVEVE